MPPNINMKILINVTIKSGKSDLHLDSKLINVFITWPMLSVSFIRIFTKE